VPLMAQMAALQLALGGRPGVMKGERRDEPVAAGLLPAERRGVPHVGAPVIEFRKAGKPPAMQPGNRKRCFMTFAGSGPEHDARRRRPKSAMLISGHKTESVFERYNISDDK